MRASLKWICKNLAARAVPPQELFSGRISVNVLQTSWNRAYSLQARTSMPTSSISPVSILSLYQPIAIPVISKITPALPSTVSLELPNFLPVQEISTPSSVRRKVVDTPITQIIRKEAARMIVIRRRKMRKHRLRKLRKRMKFVYERVKFRREQRKEKAFQAELVSMVRAAEAFDPKKYVLETLRKAKEVPRFEDILPPRPSRATFEKPNVAFKLPLKFKK